MTRRLPDPRPQVEIVAGRAHVVGQQCAACGLRTTLVVSACPGCGGELAPVRFGPDGTVWGSTVIRVPVAGRTPPYCLAYVDLDGGPRVLVHVKASTEPVAVGTRVRLRGDSGGDLVVELVR